MMNGIRKTAYRLYQFALMRGEALLPWRMPDVISGTGATASLASRVKADGVASVLIVTGPHIFASGLTASLISALEEAGIRTSVYSSVMADPTVSCVEEIRSAYIECGAQGIVAFGGGSPMDAAKAAAARIVRPDRPVASMRGLLKVGRALPPFYAVPTTAGTGSETTIAAVITDDATHRKYAITDLALLPRAAVLDPALTLGLPQHVTAATGMDALTHAVEAFTNLYNTRETRELAQKAVRLIFKNLPRAYADGSDIEARENMRMASFYAGAAFTRAGVGNVHAIAHTLGGLYKTPHGLANAVVLPHVLESFGEAVYPALSQLAEAVGISGESEREAAARFILAIRKMNSDMAIPEKFDFIKTDDISKMASWACSEANPTYPVPVMWDEAEFASVIEKLRA